MDKHHNGRGTDASLHERKPGNSGRTPGDYTASLRAGVLVTLIFFAVEVAGGYYSGSLSLISDAGHMFIDASALLLSLAAIRAARSLPTKERTYGLHRAEIVVAFCNGLFLIIMSIWILYEAFTRLSNPRPVDSTVMLLVALAGLAANAYIAYRLHGSRDLNIRSAFLHVVGDALTSLAVIGAAVWIAVTGQVAADPILSGLIAIVILVSAAKVIREAVAILLQFTPRDLDYDSVIREMESVPGVEGVHDVHIWSLSSSIFVLDAHVYSCERDVNRIGEIKREIKERLKSFRILHSTLEFECEECTEAGSSACILTPGAGKTTPHPDDPR
ncbi:MAG: cation diffusion facilitator family transporter [Methanoregulaceae archaeon]|jgi:cobalt-zinc-cadmium efflux system protein|nr:cation diffusion facilitator family transporter [Methanoregulaceae archaeon]